MKFPSTYSIGLILSIGLPACGQEIMMQSSSFGGGPDGVMHGSATFRATPSSRVVTNAPYSGQEVSESKQTLIDGTNITRQMPRGAKTYRDSQGRVRTEGNRMGGMVDANGDPMVVQISDPVAGFMYVLDNVNHVAHRVAVAAAAERPAAMARPAGAAPPGAVFGTLSAVGGGISGGGGGISGGGGGISGGGGGGGGFVGFAGGPMNGIPSANRQRPQVTTEDLGTRTIDGVVVSGTRRTTIVPEGEQGNDRPMTTTNETWRSKELQLTLLTVNYSPANGTQTTKWLNFSTSEPDPSLFMVPSSYSVVDEKQSFTIKWGEQ
jgi:hypothetical protein